MKRGFLLVAMVVLALACGGARAAEKRNAKAGNIGSQAPDFPLGSFSDGQHYDLEDFRGKLVVLFFYETSCPRCRGMVPERNKIVAAFKDKPVKFIGIGPHDSLADIRGYIAGTSLAMPTFADPFGVMQARYGFKISLNNIYQIRIVGTDGVIRAYDMTEEAINKFLPEAHWTYKDAGYHEKLAAAVDAFEWSQWATGMKLLKPHLTATDKAEKESAVKLLGEVRKVGEGWKAEAEKLAESEPVKAFDLYQRVASLFGEEELGKSVATPLNALRAKKEVAAELEARKSFAQLEAALSKATVAQKNDVVAFCKSVVKKFGETPSGEKVQGYLDELQATGN